MNTKPKIYYKCLLHDNTSVIGLSYIKLVYDLNEWTYPNIPNSKLFVFDNLTNAIKSKLGDKIYECEVIGEPERASVIADIMYVHDFWNQSKKDVMKMYAPHGTLMVDAVKITKIAHDKLKEITENA